MTPDLAGVPLVTKSRALLDNLVYTKVEVSQAAPEPYSVALVSDYLSERASWTDGNAREDSGQGWRLEIGLPVGKENSWE